MYPTYLAAALSGASLRQLGYWRKTELLVPEYGSNGRPLLYSFRDVLALRSVVYLRDESSLPAIRKAVSSLRSLGNLEHLASYNLAHFGDDIVLVNDAQTTTSLRKSPGQLGMHVAMGDIMAPFENVKGAFVVDLRRPREHLVVDPETQGGYPVIVGTRIEYDLVAGLIDDGVPPGEVADFYPAVGAAAAEDAASFGRIVKLYRDGQVPSAA